MPGSHVRVRLTLAAAGIPIDERVVKSVVERAWSTAAVEVEWIPEATPFSWKGVDLLVRVQRARPSLGAIQYENGVAHKVLQLSTDATIERLKGPVSRQYQIQEASALHLLAAGGLRDVEESLGSAIAREISPCTAAQ